MRKALLAAAALILSGCAPIAHPDRVVVTTTPIITDLTERVAGDRIEVVPLIPEGADPHTYEPTMSTLRELAYADAAFTNGLLLEDRALTSVVDANRPPESTLVELGESAIAYGGHHILLVEDSSLATTWLGLRVLGEASDETVSFRVTDVSGPGTLSAFTTGTFGQPTLWLESAGSSSEITLGTNAHTHMSWGFTAPGLYTLTIEATSEGRSLGDATVRFAVGVAPPEGVEVIDEGHIDIAVDPAGGISLTGEIRGDNVRFDPAGTVIAVPHAAVTTVPTERDWSFLGEPGSEVWILAQAVLGKHVHGEIDPHMWLDVDNTIAFVEAITDNLVALDPDGEQEYRANSASLIAELRELDAWITSVMATVPERNRTLVTTHDAYGYFAAAYGLDVTGFVSANPSLEPSAHDLTVLARTMADVGVPAVFVEKYGASASSHLVELASAQGVQVCSLNADVLLNQSYIGLMVETTTTIKTCLDPAALPPPPFGQAPTKVQP